MSEGNGSFHWKHAAVPKFKPIKSTLEAFTAD